MRVKKLLMSALTIGALIFSNVADAQVVTVTGYGNNETSAAKDARRNAVEQVVGTMLKARSVSMDMELVLDAVDARTQGYVNSFEIIKRKSEGGMVAVTARVDVSAEPNSALIKDVELVMSLNDPRIRVDVEHYGDDGGETFRRYPTMCKAQIREELLKRGFTHVVDANGEVDYVVLGNLTVEKAKAIKLPVWGAIGGAEFQTAETGLSKTIATMDCRIKKVSTDELIGEFHARGESMAADESGNQAVLNLAASAAQQVRNLFNREASKAFTSVKIIAELGNAEKALELEDTLRNTEQVTSVYVRNFSNGKCTIDVGTDLAPQQLYQVLKAAAGDTMSIKLKSFSSVVLELSIDN